MGRAGMHWHAHEMHARWFEGDSVWHKRLLLYPSARDLTYWICATPDGDVYEEGLIEADPENWAVRSYGLAGFSDQPQDSSQEVYDFEPVPLLDDIKKCMEVAKAESKRLLRTKGEELESSLNRFLLTSAGGSSK